MAYRRFEFTNTSDNLIPVLKQILDFIQSNLPAVARAERIIFNAKVILTELLTNSLKHSGSSITQMNIEINELSVQITKVDLGMPLPLINSGLVIPCKIPISNDILHTLYAIAELHDHLHFICEENNMEDILAIDDIVEHFGLLIITKAADGFSYSYERTLGSNTFTASVKLL